MLNYCAALLLNYLIFDSQSYWRDDSATGQLFPQGKTFADAATWPVWTVGSIAIPFGFVLGVVVAVVRLGALRTHAVRVRGAGDRGLAQ